MKCLYFNRVRLHVFACEICTVEADLRLPDSTFGAIENDSVLAHCLHELYQVSVMLLGHSAIDAYIIMDHNDIGEAVCHLVHVHLENVLGHLKNNWHAQEPVSSTVGVEGVKV